MRTLALLLRILVLYNRRYRTLHCHSPILSSSLFMTFAIINGGCMNKFYEPKARPWLILLSPATAKVFRLL